MAIRQRLQRVFSYVWPTTVGLVSIASVYFPGLDHARQTKDTAAVVALTIIACISIFGGGLRIVYRMLLDHSNLLQRIHNSQRISRYIQHWIAAALASCFCIVFSVYGFPSIHFITAPLVYVPGMLMLVHRFSPDDGPGHFPRPVTVRAFWFSAACAAAVGFTSMVREFLWAETFASAIWPLGTLIAPLLTFTLLMMLFAIARTSDLHRFERAFLERSTAWIEAAGRDAFWKSVADHVSVHFRYSQVAILVPDSHVSWARQAKRRSHDGMRARLADASIQVVAGCPDDVTLRIRSTSKLTDELKHVLVEAKSCVVEDAATQPEFFRQRDRRSRSILYTPVVDPNRENRVVAVIASIEPTQNTLNEHDVEKLENAARLLALQASQLTYLESQEKLGKLLHSTRHTLELEELAEKLCEVFDTRCVAVVPLSFATYRPQYSKMVITKDGFSDTARLEHWIDSCARNSVDRIGNWEPGLYTAETRIGTDEDFRILATPDSLHAILVIPIGLDTGSGCLAVLGFHTMNVAEQRHMLTLSAWLAHTRSPATSNWNDWWSYYLGFLTKNHDLHEMRDAYGTGSRHLRDLSEAILRNDVDAIRLFESNVARYFAALSDQDLPYLPLKASDSLASGIESFYKTVGNRISGIWQIHPQVELESVELKTMLLRVIAEGILNSLNHGSAKQFVVVVDRSYDEIIVVVKDDGRAFDPRELADKTPSHYGIYSLARQFSLLTGSGQIDWMWTKPGNGACFKLTIPAQGVKRELIEQERDANRTRTLIENLYEHRNKTQSSSDA